MNKSSKQELKQVINVNGQQEVVVNGMPFAFAFFVPEANGAIFKGLRIIFPKWDLVKFTHVTCSVDIDYQIDKLEPHINDIHHPGDGLVLNSHFQIFSKTHTVFVSAI